MRDENGEDLIEYGLLAAFVAAVAFVTIIADPLGIRGALQGAFEKARDPIEKVRQEIPYSPEVEQLITFIANSQRGVCR